MKAATRQQTVSMAFLMLCVSAIVAAGCGVNSGQTEPPPSPAAVTDGKISLSSPAVSPGGEIRNGFTCREKGNWLPLRWGEVPASTAELVLYVGRFKNVLQGRSPGLHIPAGSLVLGISPQRHKLNVGSYPADAAVARFRPQNLCPQLHTGHFTFQLFALSSEQRVAPETIDINTLTDLTLDSLAIGRFTAVGGRR